MKEEIIEALNLHFHDANIRFESRGDCYPIIAYVKNKIYGNLKIVIDIFLKIEIEKVIQNLGIYTEFMQKRYVCNDDVTNKAIIKVKVDKNGIEEVI